MRKRSELRGTLVASAPAHNWNWTAEFLVLMRGFSLPLAGCPSLVSESLLLPVPQLCLLLFPICRQTSLDIESTAFTPRNKDIVPMVGIGIGLEWCPCSPPTVEVVVCELLPSWAYELVSSQALEGRGASL